MSVSDYGDLFDVDDLDLDVEVSDDVEIEKLLLYSIKIRNELEYLERLKKSRIKSIDDKTEKLKNQESEIKLAMIEAMAEFCPEKNSIDFPGIGKISKRQTRGKWKITDEGELKKLSKKYKLFDELYDTNFILKKKNIEDVVTQIVQQGVDRADIKGVEYVTPDRDFVAVITIEK